MPTIITHELIGYKIAKKHPKYNKPNYYLGIVVPDAVNSNGFASKEVRWNAHKRDEDLNKWQKNIIKFYYDNLNKYPEEYLFGYLVHVLTDIIFDDFYVKKVKQDLVGKNISKNLTYEYFIKQIKKYESSQINEEWLDYVKKQLVKSKPIDINNITKKTIEEDLLNINQILISTKYDESEYIDEQFINKVVDIINEILINM